MCLVMKMKHHIVFILQKTLLKKFVLKYKYVIYPMQSIRIFCKRLLANLFVSLFIFANTIKKVVCVVFYAHIFDLIIHF